MITGVFHAQLEQLRQCLARRKEIVERIVAVINAQRGGAAEREALSRQLDACFFAGEPDDLRDQLEAAYRNGGFMPRALPGLHNDLIHPAEMLLRGLHFWQHTGWPVRNQRTHYAHTLFNVYVLRTLELLSVRLWDDDPGAAGGRLAELQGLLDELWRGSPAGQPAIVRDARWLIPLAQSLPTEALTQYLEVARLVRETLPEADALEVRKVHVRMLGGHLTSQIRHYCTRDGVAIDDSSVVLRTRVSNALDFALLVQGLVALLRAYDQAAQNGDDLARLTMAGAIFQGISPDPELFVNRVELLNAHCMMEGEFIADGPAYSALGAEHMRLADEYAALMPRLARPLREDLPRFRPVAGGCSSYGVVFGTPSTLTELMALKTLQRESEKRFSIEDVFDDRDAGAEKLAWVEGWRQMPHVDRAVQRQYDYPQEFAEEVFGRIERAFGERPEKRTGHLYLGGEGTIPELAAKYLVSSADDPEAVRRGMMEGHFLASYEGPGGWVGVKKQLLTEVLAEGRDARLAGLSAEAAGVLRLMCGRLVAAG